MELLSLILSNFESCSVFRLLSSDKSLQSIPFISSWNYYILNQRHLLVSRKTVSMYLFQPPSIFLFSILSLWHSSWCAFLKVSVIWGAFLPLLLKQFLTGLKLQPFEIFSMYIYSVVLGFPFQTLLYPNLSDASAFSYSFIVFLMDVMCSWLYVCVTGVCAGTTTRGEKTSDPLELELQVIVSNHVVLGVQP